MFPWTTSHFLSAIDVVGVQQQQLVQYTLTLPIHYKKRRRRRQEEEFQKGGERRAIGRPFEERENDILSLFLFGGKKEYCIFLSFWGYQNKYSFPSCILYCISLSLPPNWLVGWLDMLNHYMKDILLDSARNNLVTLPWMALVGSLSCPLPFLPHLLHWINSVDQW